MPKINISSIFSKGKSKGGVQEVKDSQGSEEEELYNGIVAYTRRNSLEGIASEVNEGHLVLDHYQSIAGDRTESYVVYCFNGRPVPRYNLNSNDIVISILKEDYSKLLPPHVIEKIKDNDRVFVKLNAAEGTGDYYIVVPKMLVKSEKFVDISVIKSDDKKFMNDELLITKVDQQIAAVYVRNLLFYDKDYAKKGLVIQATYNSDGMLTVKFIEPGNAERNNNTKEIVVNYDIVSNNYLISAKRIREAVSNRYSK